LTRPPAGLDRSLGIGRTTAMVVGTIIGASIFVQPSIVTSQVPGTTGVFVVWLLAGALTLAGALVCAELASAFPRSGGVYDFLRSAWGPGAGFLWGWAMFWSVHTGIAAAIAMVFARYFAQLVPLADTGQRVVAAAAILALSAVNYRGVRPASGIQAGLTAAKVVAVVALVAVLFAFGPLDGPAQRMPDMVRARDLNIHSVLLALVAGLFAFGGWHMVAYAAEETQRPERTLPAALVAGTVIVTICYLALNAAYIHVLGADRVAASQAVATEAANQVLGRGGATVTALIVMISTLGALAGVVLTGPRLYWAMARDGLLPAGLAGVHPRLHTPHRAVVLQAVWATVLVATGSYRALFTRVVYTEWLFFGAMALGMMVLRRRPGYTPHFRAPGGWLLPATFCAATLLIVVNQIVSEPVASAVGLGVVLAGLPIHLAWQRRADDRRVTQ
jgi:APA family basic amino acid/polyamine antiporter